MLGASGADQIAPGPGISRPSDLPHSSDRVCAYDALVSVEQIRGIFCSTETNAERS